jgi:IS5 family transposase
MKQTTLAFTGFELVTKKTRKREFLEQHKGTVLRLSHLLESNNLASQILATIYAKLIELGLLLKVGTVVEATLIPAPSSTKYSSGEHEPVMHQSQKGNQCHFGMKAHISADAESGLVHTLTGTADNEHYITKTQTFLHGEEAVLFADSDYRGFTNREEIQAQHPGVDWQVIMMPFKLETLKKSNTVAAIIDKLEKIKASIRAKVESPFMNNSVSHHPQTAQHKQRYQFHHVFDQAPIPRLVITKLALDYTTAAG